MDHQISKLVKRGHDAASELKASCGTVDVRAVAQLLSDLATQLDVSRVALTQSRREFTAANANIHNLELKVGRVVAENAQMLRLLTDISENHDEYVNADEYMYAGIPLDYVSEINMYVSRDVNAENPFKATDAYLAEVRAQARDEGINYAASRLAAAFNHGFVDKPLAEVYDVVRMILTAKEDLANDPSPDGLSGEYAEKSLVEFAAQLRQGVGQ